MYSEKPLLHKRQAESKPGGLRTFAIDVTGKCNMTCDHCYAESFRKAKQVDQEALLKTLDELYVLGVQHLVIQGGEAILDSERLEFILRNCHADETYINVVSNGWGMSLEKIQWLKALKVDKIAFSLDSGIREEHDKIRLPGSYDRVLNAIYNVQNEGLLASFSIVVTSESLYSEGFNAALKIVKEKKIRMDVQIAEPVGKWDGNKDILINPEDAIYIKELQKTLGTLPTGQNVISRDTYCGEKDHCPAGTNTMSLSADGNVLPCNFLQFSLGNISDKSVAEMRNDLLTSDWFDDSHPTCLCGEDNEFINKFIVPYANQPKPLDALKVFNLGKGSKAEPS
ncbi:MAG: radical SAM protein [Rhodospirillales bacterium]|nr:radical SAM protein [Rhodospirillales bacterium]